LFLTFFVKRSHSPNIFRIKIYDTALYEIRVKKDQEKEKGFSVTSFYIVVNYGIFTQNV